MAYTIITPKMTSNTLPSGVLTSELDRTTLYYMLDEYFDGYLTNFNYLFGNTTLSAKNPPHWVNYEFDTPQFCTDYRMFFVFAPTGLATDWVLQGSNDGVTYTDLHTMAGYTQAEAEAYTPYFNVPNPGSYKHIRLYVTDWTSRIAGYQPDTFAVKALELYAYSAEFEAPAADIGPMTPEVPWYFLGNFAQAPVTNLGLTAESPLWTLTPEPKLAPAAILPLTPVAPTFRAVPNPAIPASIIYQCLLIGAGTDLIIPITSYQCRYRNNADSYLSVIVPDGASYIDDITDKTGGQIVLRRGVRYYDGVEQLTELIKVNLEDIRDSSGGASRSIELSGHVASSFAGGRTFNLNGAFYRFGGTGKRRFRVLLDTDLRPGDFAVVDGDTIVVGLITYTVSTYEQMEITEA